MLIKHVKRLLILTLVFKNASRSKGCSSSIDENHMDDYTNKNDFTFEDKKDQTKDTGITNNLKTSASKIEESKENWRVFENKREINKQISSEIIQKTNKIKKKCES